MGWVIKGENKGLSVGDTFLDPATGERGRVTDIPYEWHVRVTFDDGRVEDFPYDPHQSYGELEQHQRLIPRGGTITKKAYAVGDTFTDPDTGGVGQVTSSHVWLVIRGEKSSNKISLIREMVESLFKAGVSETNELFMSARDDYEAGDLDEAIKKFYDLMQREGLQEDAAQAIEFAEILAKQRYGDTGQVVRAANNMEFTVNAQAKVTVGIADIEKRPEVERLRATDLPVERKAERARQFAPQMLKEIVADKLRGINEYASSQGIVMINAGSPEPEDGNIDWVDYFRRFERSKPGATKPKEGGINEPEEVV